MAEKQYSYLPKLPEKSDDERAYAQEVLDVLYKHYPDAYCALDHDNPFELLCATILSAQCTDVRVNKVTPDLFEAYPTPEAMAEAPPQELEELVRSTGFYRNKSKALKQSSQTIVEKHDGKVPQNMKDLLELYGVARKTANVVLGNAFDINVGVVVDTHVRRISNRLGLTNHEKNVKKIEKDLMALFPREHWTNLSHLMIHHGRNACKARISEPPDHPICAQYGKACECREMRKSD